MSGTYTVTMGDRGRLVVPMELREHVGIGAGDTLILVETPAGVVMMTREQALEQIHTQLAGPSLVAELVAERRAAAVEDGG
ncbi:AbrB/MazE/SpoVT family DNA-binding domain-containing protein [Cellulomonas phragmiteti]|nr:AbrB/MazE/SpoVT family DNA-binding domain-containing protein [Cellulomonas phragmiteti]